MFVEFLNYDALFPPILSGFYFGKVLRIYGILKIIAFDLHDFTWEKECLGSQRDLALYTLSPIYKVPLDFTSLFSQKQIHNISAQGFSYAKLFQE